MTADVADRIGPGENGLDLEHLVDGVRRIADGRDLCQGGAGDVRLEGDRDDLPGDADAEHGGHRWAMRGNGSRHCYDCPATDYDSQWGAGIFSDWPIGHHKPYGE